MPKRNRKFIFILLVLLILFFSSVFIGINSKGKQIVENRAAEQKPLTLQDKALELLPMIEEYKTTSPSDELYNSIVSDAEDIKNDLPDTNSWK